jgi:two-component system, chemotaxis family, response regulator WspR
MTHSVVPPSVVPPAVGQVSFVKHVVAWQNPGKSDPDKSDSYQQNVLASVLQQRGYCVTALKREREVFQSVLENLPDLLIIYLQTSGEQGYEFCKLLRKLPRTQALPIVFVGTRAPFSELASALRCGGNEYLQLPLSDEECWLRLERHLRTLQLVRSLESERASLHQEIWSYSHILRQQEANQVSLSRENQALHRLAFTDGLTKVANRSSFDNKIFQLWHQAKAYGQPISLLLCDVDYFKRYNDTYGHLAGDRCLQAVADALVRAAHRHSDQVARYGGEEFAILLPATDSQGAQQVAQAIRSELARSQVPHASSLVKPYVSMSIGICTLAPTMAPSAAPTRAPSSAPATTSASDDGLGNGELSYETLIQGADEALYTAKRQGRDRAVVYTPKGLASIPRDHSKPNAFSSLVLPVLSSVTKLPMRA